MKKPTMRISTHVLLVAALFLSSAAEATLSTAGEVWSARFLSKTAQLKVLDSLLVPESDSSAVQAWLIVGSSQSRETTTDQTLHLWGFGGDGSQIVSTPIAAGEQLGSVGYLALAQLESGDVAVAYEQNDAVIVRTFSESGPGEPREIRLPESVSSIGRAVIHPDARLTIQVVEGTTRALLHFGDGDEPLWHRSLSVAGKTVLSVVGLRARGPETVLVGAVSNPLDPEQTSAWVAVIGESGEVRSSRVIETEPRVIPLLIASESDEIVVQLGSATRRQPVRIARFSANLEPLGDELLPTLDTENRPFSVAQRCSANFVYGTRQKIPNQGNLIRLTEVLDGKASNTFALEIQDQDNLKSVVDIVLDAESRMLLAAATIVKMNEQRQFDSGIDLALYQLEACQSGNGVDQANVSAR